MLIVFAIDSAGPSVERNRAKLQLNRELPALRGLAIEALCGRFIVCARLWQLFFKSEKWFKK